MEELLRSNRQSIPILTWLTAVETILVHPSWFLQLLSRNSKKTWLLTQKDQV